MTVFLPGDRLVLFTDGIVEAMDKNKQLYDMHRLLNITTKCSGFAPKDYLENVLRDVTEFSADAPLHDDQAIICVDYKG